MTTIIGSGNATYRSFRNVLRCLMSTILVFTGYCCKAQLNPYEAMYFQNRYLINPAMAGLDKGITINLAYQQQWTPFPGSPRLQSLTAEYQTADKVGLGLNINDEQSGLFRQTRFMGTYAYHLPLSDRNEKLNFGLSLGIGDSRIDYNSVVGDLTDVELQQYNQKGPYIDADLGIAYTSNNLFIEGVVPNLNTTIFNRAQQRADVDRTVFFGAVSYQIPMSNDITTFSLEPLAAYRVVKGFNNIFDLGLNLKMPVNHLDLHTIYHTNDNWSFGLNLDEPRYAISFNYNLYTGAISNYADGAFEFGLKLRLPGK